MSRRVEGGSSSAQPGQQPQHHYVGPYKLGKTLGKGQTGLVKKATHVVTNKLYAIKIINREHLNESVQAKVEREIAIMKLLEHQHVLKIVDVYENRKNLYLVLEHVAGGELFDYLVRKGRLSPREANKFFKQIVSAVDFCHQHNVCHRDLKPENLLLDSQNNIKVADFGMASLQPAGNMLETSCGSPHYACPEVIRGDKYDGTAADVWSLGVILFALLVGALPFDDDNLRTLLEKVKRGVYHIPHFVPSEAQQLIRGMICTDTKKRLTLKQVLSHPWMTKGGEPFEGPKVDPRTQDIYFTNEDELDPDVMASMSSLGCFKDREQLVAKLLSNEECTEKYVYQLLLRRKERHPSMEDDENRFGYDVSKLGQDRPRKRTDSTASLNKLASVSRKNSLNGMNNTGSTPSTPQRSCSTHTNVGFTGRGRSSSSSGVTGARTRFSWSSVATPRTSPNHSAISTPLTSANSSRASSPPNTPSGGSWTKRISNSIKNSFLGTPKFHRRRTSRDSSSGELDNMGMHNSSSTDSEKKSWFKEVWNSVGNTDGIYTLYIEADDLQRVKNRLVQAFLYVPNLNHSFRHHSLIEISCNDPSSIPFQSHKPFKAQVEITRIHNNRFQVIIRLLSGNTKRFARTCVKIQQVVEAYENRARAQYQDQNMNMASEISRVTAELETMCNSLQKQPVYRPV
ncbi:Oidioi.mRNA.OKI2018_I69.chr2.g7630.t1.cds [Oikopleura dioica]|uniref:non-specific serine/threonine protein kinase n=1 Tax=Oikopleura dioica TaxID=34765 RepID=A0ABN7TFL8_OIKDI|nr:Oidioi.mRNA.OKI2018_I69.chr2.g7630.t1.cds [Oikopleura dioica]